MNFGTLRKASALLRRGAELEKRGGATVDLLKALGRGSAAASEAISQTHPLMGAATRVAPVAGAGYLGVKGYQKAKRKIDEIKYRRMLRRQGMM